MFGPDTPGVPPGSDVSSLAKPKLPMVEPLLPLQMGLTIVPPIELSNPTIGCTVEKYGLAVSMTLYR